MARVSVRFLVVVSLWIVSEAEKVRNEYETLEGTKQEDGTVTFANQCQRDLLYAWKSRKLTWMQKMLDANGKPSGSMVDGNIFWFGDYDQCLKVQAPINELSPQGFRGRYVWMDWNSKNGWTESTNRFTSGACFPDSCSEAEIERLWSAVLNTLGEEYPNIKGLAQNLNLMYTRCVRPHPPWSTAARCCMALLGFLVSLCSLATAVDYILIGEDTDDNEKAFANGISKPKTPQHNSRLVKVLCCFSLSRNFRSIFAMDIHAGQLPSLNGIRFITMMWIIMGHVFVNAMTITGDLVTGLEKMDVLAMQFMVTSEFSVDTFFLLSGFLVAYVFLKSNLTEHMTLSKWGWFYLHRFIRISPTFFLIVFIGSTLLPYIDNGPYWLYMDQTTGQCPDFWWKHLLYIGNFFKTNFECLPWLWYLPTDMQFYWISPVFLYLLKKKPRTGVLTVCAVMLGSTITVFTLSYYYEFTNKMLYLRQVKTDSSHAHDTLSVEAHLISTKPYCRIGPYLIGILLAHFVYVNGKIRTGSFKGRTFLGWLIAFLNALMVLFGMYMLEVDRLGFSIFNAISRQLWTASIAWVIYACVTGRGGLINSFLSWKMFQPLGRLSFCAYLTHPLFIFALYFGVRQPLQANLNFGVVGFFGIAFLSFLSATALSLLVESPTVSLERLLLRPPPASTTPTDKGHAKDNVWLH